MNAESLSFAAEEVSESALIHAYLAGDEQAFETLYARHRRVILHVVNALVAPDYAMADDLFQQSWVRIIQALPKYREQDQFMAWACRIARNAALDYLRRQKRGAVLFPDGHDAERLGDHLADEPGEPDSPVSDEALQGAIAALNPLQREVLLLREQQVPFKEIAAIQSCSVNTALGRYHDALNALRRMLVHPE